MLVIAALTALAFFTRFYKINNPDEVVYVQVFVNSQHTENSHATGSTKSTSESSRHTTFWESIISMCTLHLQS